MPGIGSLILEIDIKISKENEKANTFLISKTNDRVC